MTCDFSQEFIDALILAVDRRRTELRAREAFANAYRDALRVLTPEQASEVIALVGRTYVAALERKSLLKVRRGVPREAATEEMAELLRAGFAEAAHEGRDQE